MTSIRLAPLTADNRDAVAALALDPTQRDFVANPIESLEDADSDPAARFRVVMEGSQVVGYLMYETLEIENLPDEVSIYRFMIDRAHQGKGYGRATLDALIAEIRTLPGIRRVSICYMPDNSGARELYRKFGFVEMGTDADGEILASFTLPDVGA